MGMAVGLEGGADNQHRVHFEVNREKLQFNVAVELMNGGPVSVHELAEATRPLKETALGTSSSTPTPSSVIFGSCEPSTKSL